MRTGIKNTLFWLLLLLLPLAAQTPAARFSLALIPLANRGVEPAAVDRFNQSMNQALLWLADNPGLRLVAADSVASLLDDAITPDFPDIYEPFSLARANLDLRLEALLFCQLERQQGRLVLAARSYEFPSGVLVAENFAGLAGDSLPAIGQLLEPLLASLARRDPRFGHPFQEAEQGVLLLTGPLEDDPHFESCQGFFAALQFDEGGAPLRIKILPRDQLAASGAEMEGIARDLGNLTRARWVFNLAPAAAGTEVRFRLAPPVFQERPPMEQSFPFHSGLAGLEWITLAADTMGAGMINAALLQAPEQPLAVASDAAWQKNPLLALRSAVRSHAAWALSSSPRSAAGPASSETLYRLVLASAPQKQLRAWSALNLGALLNQLGRRLEAIKVLREAEALFGPLADPEGMILSRRELASAHAARQEWPQARQALERLENMPPDSLTRALVLEKIAQHFEKEGRTAEAVQSYYRAAQINQAIGRPYEAAMVYQRLGQMMREKGELDRSLAYLDTFYTQAQALASEPALARAHFQLGLTRLARSEREPALNHFLTAGDYLEMLGDRSGVARADLNVGAIYWQMGDTLKARQRYLAAINQATVLGDSAIVLLSAVNLADIQLTQKNFSQAQAFFDRALAIAGAARNAKEQARITYAKGMAYLKEGRLRAGYASIKEAMALGGGSVNGDRAREEAFLEKLSVLIGDIEHLRGQPAVR